MLDQAHAGSLRERARFFTPALDNNGDALGALVELFTISAKIESDPGPVRDVAQRLEGQAVICLVVRSTRRTRALASGQFVRWLRYPARLYQLREPTEDARRMWISLYATAYAGGAGA